MPVSRGCHRTPYPLRRGWGVGGTCVLLLRRPSFSRKLLVLAPACRALFSSWTVSHGIPQSKIKLISSALAGRSNNYRFDIARGTGINGALSLLADISRYACCPVLRGTRQERRNKGAGQTLINCCLIAHEMGAIVTESTAPYPAYVTIHEAFGVDNHLFAHGDTVRWSLIPNVAGEQRFPGREISHSPLARPKHPVQHRRWRRFSSLNKGLFVNKTTPRCVDDNGMLLQSLSRGLQHHRRGRVGRVDRDDIHMPQHLIEIFQ